LIGVLTVGEHPDRRLAQGGPVSCAPSDFGFGQPDARESDAQGWQWYKTPRVIEKGRPLAVADACISRYRPLGSPRDFPKFAASRALIDSTCRQIAVSGVLGYRGFLQLVQPTPEDTATSCIRGPANPTISRKSVDPAE